MFSSTECSLLLGAVLDETTCLLSPGRQFVSFYSCSSMFSSTECSLLLGALDETTCLLSPGRQFASFYSCLNIYSIRSKSIMFLSLALCITLVYRVIQDRENIPAGCTTGLSNLGIRLLVSSTHVVACCL